MLGLLTPIEGTLSISDTNITDDIEIYRRKLSYIPESPVIYEELTLEEHIAMTAMAYQISKEEAMKRARPLLKHLDLKMNLMFFLAIFKRHETKVMIICAFIVNPELYIIDEPFLGLDPLGIQSMLDLMVEKKMKGVQY